jgi:hypothetical protein
MVEQWSKLFTDRNESVERSTLGGSLMKFLDSVKKQEHEKYKTMNDSRAPAGGRCIMMRSTNGVTYYLLWDGSTAAVRDHWKIVRADDHGQVNKVQLDRLTVFVSGPSQDELASLDESRLDEALLRLFGLATG